jgi:phage terminase Nu1 subunit (DNA packaging protein)
MTADDFDFEGDTDKIPLRGLNKRELCAVFDISPKTLNRWILEGLPSYSSGSRKGGLRFDLTAAIAWRRAADVAELGGDGDTLANAKRRNALAQARRREIDNAKLEGQLFPMDLLQKVIADRYSQFRQRLQMVDLSAFGLTERQRDDIQRAVDDALNDISVMKFSEDLDCEMEEPSETEFG